MTRGKVYDRRYFDRWYRDPKHRVKSAGALERKVRAAVSLAEFYLGRPIESVLDVGCGEGAWVKPLRALRPRVRYLGVDSSEYAVRRYGRTRNLVHARFGDLGEQRFDAPVDLLVCSDVMHYVPTAELKRGLSGFRHLCDGFAYLEVLAKEDEFYGDTQDFVPRAAAWYRREFALAGFHSCGSHGYLSSNLLARASSLELGVMGG